MGFDENVEMIKISFLPSVNIKWSIFRSSISNWINNRNCSSSNLYQEMTLSFVPKIVIVIFAIGFLANFLLVSLTDYFNFIFDTISGIN